MFKHILVPTDGSELSQQAITHAVAFAKETGARITAFYAKPDYQLGNIGDGLLNDLLSPEKFDEKADRHAHECLEDAHQACEAANVACNMVAIDSNTLYKAIIDTAEREGCDLIFMASHGRSGLSGLLIGSETNKVLSHSKIPVLVYR